MSIQVQWHFPFDLPVNFTKQRILRSGQENGSYNIVREIDVFSNSIPVSNFIDPTGNPQSFYIVKFYDPNSKLEFNDFVLGFFPPTPREKRFRIWLDEWAPEVMKPELTDFVVGQSIRYSINTYNLIPAFTNFNISSLPEADEQFIIVGAKVWLIYLKYLKLSIRDFSYSDMGLTLNIDRGTKMNQALEQLNKMYSEFVKPAKWRYTPQGVGLGSVYLPVSMGAQISRGALNILDIFNAMGR